MKTIKSLAIIFLITLSSAYAEAFCSSTDKTVKFDLSGLMYDKTVQINFYQNGFNLQTVSKSKNNLLLLIDGRKAYNLNMAPYSVYSQSSALSADYFTCQDAAEACSKVNVEIVSQLNKAYAKVNKNNTEAISAIKCALSMAKTMAKTIN